MSSPLVKVALGMAIGHGSTRWETSMALLGLLSSIKTGYHFTILPGGGCDVAHARNLMIHHTLTRTDCDYLFFIDSDVRFNPDDVFRLLDRMTADPSIEILAGLYPLKGLPLKWSWGLWAEGSTTRPGLWEVGEIRAGFTVLRTSLLRRLCQAYPETGYLIEDAAYRNEPGNELCAMGPVTREWAPGCTYSRRLSEDFYLSMRIRDLGIPIYVDPTVLTGHVGDFDFKRLHSGAELKPGVA